MTTERLALIGPFTWDLLAPTLTAALRLYGLTTQIKTYGFGRDAAVWSLSDADFEANPPQGAIVFSDARQLFQELLANPRSSGSPADTGRMAAHFVVACVNRVGAKHRGIAWILATVEATFPGPGDGVADPDMDPFTIAVESFNAELLAAVRAHPGWTIFQRDRLSKQYGQAALRDPRLELLGRFPASPAGGRLIAERLAAHWAAVRGKMKKVIALDCDNTLWGGIVGEDGVQGIHVGSDGVGRAYAEFQQALLTLESRGVLLAICSRNNADDVREVFAGRPEMLLRDDHFAAKNIDWGRKSVGLRSLAATLGLGLDSFVFIDDNPVERDEIRQALPEVAVPEFPADPADLPAFGYDLAWRYFYRTSLSDEDRRRTAQYHARAEIETARQSAGDTDEFLTSLNMTARISVNLDSLVNRNAQLTQKTNQFNLTLRRYAESDMAAMTAASDVLVFSGSLADRFSDHGWVALAIFRLGPDALRWQVDSFLISCRVLGRGFEREFLAKCIEGARFDRDLPIHAEYVPGPKNAQTARFFDELGFQIVAEKAGGARSYELPVDAQPTVVDAHVSFSWV